MIKNFNSVRFLLFLFVVFPFLTYAYDPAVTAIANSKVSTTPSSFKALIMIAVNLITAILPVIILLAFIYFLWGLAQYLKDTGENRDEAKHVMLAGVIGFFVMSSVWGLVSILSATLGTSQTKPDLTTSETYFEGTEVLNVLRKSQDSLIRDPGSTSNTTTDSNGSTAPSWFSQLMPWNWF
mgnify:FL=1